MSVTRVTCLNCGRSTIKGKFCIYCGYVLEEEKQPAQKAAKEEEATITIPAAQASGEQQVAEIQPPSPAEESLEEKNLTDQIANVYGWWSRLLDLLLRKECPPHIFSELYNEYRSRITMLNEKRMSEIKSIEDRLHELNTRMEQLRVRHEIGEIPDRQYVTQKLDIDREMGRLKPKLAILQNPFNLKLADVPSFQQQLEEKLAAFSNASPEELGIEPELVEAIKHDIRTALDMLQILMEQYKKIKLGLDKLEIRYKIGELKREDYLSQKQKLERQLELQAGSI
ncbi:MAG: hypothetical protein NXY59_07400 [Aigarchaeota archaeon]|nr:hypothetical protein [Candidatus Pelearchaeum maunauluense]